eukprot:Skav207104  [mRNA]  locus=scaffold156:15530:19231:- [translate_table: standard]
MDPLRIDKGFIQVDASENLGSTKRKQRVVRVHNTNTGALLLCTVQLTEGRAAVDGEVAISGVTGVVGIEVGKFNEIEALATLRDTLEVPGDGPESTAEVVEVTLLDAGQPMVFMRATDLFKQQPEVATAGPKAQAEAGPGKQ